MRPSLPSRKPGQRSKTRLKPARPWGATTTESAEKRQLAAEIAAVRQALTKKNPLAFLKAKFRSVKPSMWLGFEQVLRVPKAVDVMELARHVRDARINSLRPKK